MAEIFDNLDNILHDWVLNRKEKHSLAEKKKDKVVSFLENDSEKILEQSAVERD